jgi:hypothetical protein
MIKKDTKGMFRVAIFVIVTLTIIWAAWNISNIPS